MCEAGSPPSGPSPAENVWRARPLFITSTFRDMHAERDHLRAVVFPELEERLQERHVHLEPVDLRLGVETITAGEEEKRDLQVLKVCLGEIHRSRPFLIALIGDRYGWVPPSGRMLAAAREAGLELQPEGKSVTALEIELGILASTDQRLRTHVYLREPLPYASMGLRASDYSDLHGDAPETSGSAASLEALKERLKRDPRLAGRVHAYRAQWDPSAQKVTGLEAWGRSVVEDLWRDLDEETRTAIVAIPDSWEQRERLALGEFAEQRTLGFSGREALLKRLLDHAHSPVEDDAVRALCVTGEAGSGKSAVFSRVLQTLGSAGGPLLLAVAPGAGVRSASVDATLLRWTGELAAASSDRVAGPESETPAEIEQRFRNLLVEVSRDRRVVLLLDALDQFEATTRARRLSWLPRPLPPNVRLIATSQPGVCSEAVAQLGAAEVVALEPLSTGEALRLVAEVYRRYHREQSSEVVGAMLRKRLPDGRAAAGNPLWLTLATEELHLLDMDDFARAERDFTGTPDERLHQLLLDTADRLPADIEGLYQWVLTRAELNFGRAWAQAFAQATAASHDGLRESDLRQLLPRLAAEPWEDLKFAALRRGLRAHLVRRDENERWDFAHEQMRRAVSGRMVGSFGDEGARERWHQVHAVVLEHLEGLPAEDSLRATKGVYHAIAADRPGDAARLFARAEGVALGHATAELAAHFIEEEEQREQASAEFLARMADSTGDDATLRLALARRITFGLRDTLQFRTSVRVQRSCLESGLRLLDRARPPAVSRWEVDDVYACCLDRLADLDVDDSNFDLALQRYERALALREAHRGSVPDPGRLTRDLSVSHDKIGDVLQHGRPADPRGALRHYETALGLRLESRPEAGSGRARDRDLSLSFNRISEVRETLGDHAGALENLERSLEIRRELARSAPDDDRAQRDLDVVLHARARRLALLGRIADARADFAHVLQRCRDRLALDPRSLICRRDLCIALEGVGAGALAALDVPASLAALREGIGVLRDLRERDPGRADIAELVERSFDTASRLVQALDRSERLAHHADSIIALMRELAGLLQEPGAPSSRVTGLLEMSTLVAYRLQGIPECAGAVMGLSAEIVIVALSNPEAWPAAPGWRVGAIVVTANLGLRLADHGAAEQAEWAVRLAIELGEQLLRQECETSWARDRISFLYGWLAARTADETETARLCLRGTEVADGLLAEKADDPRWIQTVLWMYVKALAWIAGDGSPMHGEALAEGRAAIERSRRLMRAKGVEAVGAREMARANYLLARTEAGCGEGPAALASVRRALPVLRQLPGEQRLAQAAVLREMAAALENTRQDESVRGLLACAAELAG